MKVIKDLTQSKKAWVYLVAVVVMTGVVFGDLDPVLAHEFVDKMTALTMAYLGGQGAADLGKYLGEAWASGKALAASAVDDDETDVGDALEVAAKVVQEIQDEETPREP